MSRFGDLNIGDRLEIQAEVLELKDVLVLTCLLASVLWRSCWKFPLLLEGGWCVVVVFVRARAWLLC